MTTMRLENACCLFVREWIRASTTYSARTVLPVPAVECSWICKASLMSPVQAPEYSGQDIGVDDGGRYCVLQHLTFPSGVVEYSVVFLDSDQIYTSVCPTYTRQPWRKCYIYLVITGADCLWQDAAARKFYEVAGKSLEDDWTEFCSGGKMCFA